MERVISEHPDPCQPISFGPVPNGPERLSSSCISDILTGVITGVITVEVHGMHALTRTLIGRAVGVILPRSILAWLKLAEREGVFVSEAPDGLRMTR